MPGVCSRADRSTTVAPDWPYVKCLFVKIAPLFVKWHHYSTQITRKWTLISHTLATTVVLGQVPGFGSVIVISVGDVLPVQPLKQCSGPGN
jgi:hypothetical protein